MSCFCDDDFPDDDEDDELLEPDDELLCDELLLSLLSELSFFYRTVTVMLLNINQTLFCNIRFQNEHRRLPASFGSSPFLSATAVNKSQ